MNILKLIKVALKAAKDEIKAEDMEAYEAIIAHIEVIGLTDWVDFDEWASDKISEDDNPLNIMLAEESRQEWIERINNLEGISLGIKHILYEALETMIPYTE